MLAGSSQPTLSVTALFSIPPQTTMHACPRIPNEFETSWQLRIYALGLNDRVNAAKHRQ